MALFQTIILRKYASSADATFIDDRWTLFISYFQNLEIQNNILRQKEEQFQEGFLRELFVNVLGYTINPDINYNLSTEFKNTKDSKKADGAIAFDGNVRAVIELKSAKTTDLGRVESQAFSYKNNHKGCRYVIISNFQKLRFYIDDAVDFIEWDLFTIDKEAFVFLFLILGKESIAGNLPLEMKNASVSEETRVTKKLYKEYSTFRRELLHNIVARNTELNRTFLVKKTQKLLDRFLFLFFAEDRLLIPPNSVRNILIEWTELREKFDESQPLYDRFKKFFQYLNVGHKSKFHDIFAYNGGLFACDDILDSIAIDDDVLYSGCNILSKYDYATEIDVNILGHIFENSLTEIEKLHEEYSTDESGTILDKRKKDGVFYTPRYITKYIVEKTLGTVCKNGRRNHGIKEEEYHADIPKNKKRQLLAQLNDYRAWLLKLTILDPSCGSGAFLNQALEFLIAEHKLVSELEAKVTGSSIVFDVENAILENNLYGVDINEESVEIAKLSLWLRTAQKGRKLTSLNNNVKCGNSLIDDPNVAGDSAFNWQEEFPIVYANGGFDIVIGNPPYGIYIDKQHEKYLNENFQLATYKTNLYVLFIERILKLQTKGIVSFIIPKSLLINSYYSKIREYLIKNVDVIELFSISEKVFDDAEVGGSLILTFAPNRTDIVTRLVSVLSFLDYPFDAVISQVDLTQFLSIPNCEISIVADESQALKMKVLTNPPLSESFAVKNGLNPGNVKHILISKKKASEFHKPMILGRDINRYGINWSKHYVNYDSNIKNSISLSDTKSKKGMAEQSKVDFALRTPDIFEVEKLVIRKTGDKLICTLDERNFYFDTLVHGIYPRGDISLKKLLAVLNSNCATALYRVLHDIKGKVFAKISVDNLLTFPIPSALEAADDLEAAVDIVMTSSRRIDELSDSFAVLFHNTFPDIDVVMNLPNIDNSHFLKILTKARVPLLQQQEWLQYFGEKKEELRLLQIEHQNQLAKIERRVIALYGLNEKEVNELGISVSA